MLHELNVLSDPPGEAAGTKSLAGDRPPQRADEAPGYDAAEADGDVLTDGFGRRHTYLRLSLVERCNLRCRYCMPAEGIAFSDSSQLLSDDELLRLARLFVEAGVTKIRLTGGEPLLRPGVERITERIAALPGLQTLGMTTNGLLLPKKLDRLERAGVTKLNISLDTLRPGRFEEMTRRAGHSLVLDAIEAAAAHGYAPVKVNCVVMRGVNDDEVLDFVAWTQDRPVEVRFIEYMPFGGNGWQGDHLVPNAALLERIRARYPGLQSLDDGPHATARTYRVPGFTGRFGFISSMTNPFCEGCNRLRLTADGHLKVCLFGKTETRLRDPLRGGASDEALRTLISRAVGRKKARHAGVNLEAARAEENRPMTTIGG